jgi:hypothetical protein
MVVLRLLINVVVYREWHLLCMQKRRFVTAYILLLPSTTAKYGRFSGSIQLWSWEVHTFRSSIFIDKYNEIQRRQEQSNPFCDRASVVDRESHIVTWWLHYSFEGSSLQ